MIPMLVSRAGQDEIPAMNDSIDRFVATAITQRSRRTRPSQSSFWRAWIRHQNDDERSREIIRSAIAFMHTHLQSSTRAFADEKLLRVISENLCYLFLVAHESHFSFFQYHLSSHEFFRLLSYTASYF